MSNFNFIEYMSHDEVIRPPDLPITEVLVNRYDVNYNINYGDNYNNIIINPNDYEYELQLQLAINESIKEQEYEKNQSAILEEENFQQSQIDFLKRIEEEEYEKQQLVTLEETKLRVKIFKNISLKLKKLSMIDKTFLEFYKIIQPLLDSYYACYIDIYDCNKVMYDVIFTNLKKIRLTECELGLFKKIFVIEI